MDRCIDRYLDGRMERDRQTHRQIFCGLILSSVWPWHWISLWQSLTEHSIPNENFLNFQLQDLIGVFWMKEMQGSSFMCPYLRALVSLNTLGVPLVCSAAKSADERSLPGWRSGLLWVKCDIKCWASCQYLCP